MKTGDGWGIIKPKKTSADAEKPTKAGGDFEEEPTRRVNTEGFLEKLASAASGRESSPKKLKEVDKDSFSIRRDSSVVRRGKGLERRPPTAPRIPANEFVQERQTMDIEDDDILAVRDD